MGTSSRGVSRWQTWCVRHFAALVCCLLVVSHGNAVAAVIEGDEVARWTETAQDRLLESSNSGSVADEVHEFALQEGSDSTVSEVDEDGCDCEPRSQWKKVVVVAVAFVLILLAAWHYRNKPDDAGWTETSG